MTMDESLKPRTIDLELDGGSGHLGANTPTEIGENAKRMEALEFHKWGVHADIVSVQQGQLGGKQCSIIALNIRFLFDDNGSRSRLSEAKITTTFESHSELTTNSTTTSSPPVVKLYSPKLLEGPVRLISRSDETERQASISAMLSIVQPTVGISRRIGEEYSLDSRMQIKGKRWASSRNFKEDNQGIWTLLEESKQGEGIPSEFTLAILLQHDNRPFQGTVRVMAKTKSGIRVLGWPWSSPKPAVFRPGVSFGEQLEVEDFGQLSDEHWRQLCDFPGLISVRLSLVTLTVLTRTVISMDRKVEGCPTNH
jgi:hypothetical protein